METESSAPSVPTCYRHPERETYIRCQRCERHICPDCQRQAAVGFQCVECVRDGARTTPTARTRFGGVVRADGAVVTKILLGLNLAAFALIFLGANQGLVQRLQLVGQGAFAGGVADGEYWRLLTSAFVHVDVWHIGLNMLSLWVLGRPLEVLLGRLRFTGLYLMSALAGSAVAYALTPPLIGTIGASGAIFGLFGATIVLYRRIQADMSWLVGLLAVNLIGNVLFRDILSWQAHLGGLIAGLLLGGFIMYAPRERRDQVQALGFVVVLVLTAAVVVWRTVSLLSGAAVF